jgi:GTP-binding protein
MDIRNIAIIAHVDHGKTTLTDALMKQNGIVLDEGVSMDSNALEKERGITIYAKNTSIYYKDTKINIVDTPGHADFGSEVERVLRAIDSVLLLVDAVEGPMPQTRFVLKKSLELGLKPIVVINKIDKPAADIARVHDEILELFLELGANDEQTDFKTIYAIGREGKAFKNIGDNSNDLSPLLDLILEIVPVASLDKTGKLQAQVFNLAYDNFLGRMAICRVYEGSIKNASSLVVKGENGSRNGKITKLFTFEGTMRKEVASASRGDIVMIAGIPDIFIGETLCEDESVEALPHIAIDEPTLSLNFLVNDSPFAGKEGKFVTSRQIKERLEKELEINVGLRVDFSPDQGEDKSGPSFFKVYGRGELHIAVLLENMRREGFEMQISRPQVIYKEIDGKTCEPFEEVTIDVHPSHVGAVNEEMGKRKAIMQSMHNDLTGSARLVFKVSSANILGLRNIMLTNTRGTAVISTYFLGYEPKGSKLESLRNGALVATQTGTAASYGLVGAQERGSLFISPGDPVYEGMVVGVASKPMDIEVNAIKEKQLTNNRSSGEGVKESLTSASKLSLEQSLDFIEDDELLEVTPISLRIRKRFLTEADRRVAKRSAQK